MGTIDDNEGSPFWDVNAASGVGGWIYASSRKTPASHEFSPPMNLAQVQVAIAAADNTETQWVNAHPAPVKVWLNNRTAAQRANHKAGCQKMALL